jgi:cysteine desulfuration protein SufE
MATESKSAGPPRLEEIVDEFADLDVRERLETLLDFAESLPPLPERLQAERDAGDHRVHECQTPVYLWVEVADGRVQVFGDSAPEAPTVKGFLAVLVDAFSGASVDQVLAVGPDLLSRLGLVEALGMIRMRGLQAILFHIRRRVAEAAGRSLG